MEQQHTNALAGESSPYLLQHAHNPVHWYPWGEEALEKARQENKVILVSIGYSACHWCHVMERESFEDEATAAIMNQYFVNIKIDREERPDIDHIYMDAVQAMTGSGGWPLNVFLTPGREPFYGGTYFPPVRAYNRASWKEVLHGVAQAWRERPTEIQAQAENLLDHLRQSGRFVQGVADTPAAGSLFTAAQCHSMFHAVMQQADTQWGGFGGAPKFPQTFTIGFLLQYHHFTGNAAALNQALLSLDKMMDGGIYDQAGGGFARYSTDAEWLAPHFEKMLYDNALLLTVLCDAYALTRADRYAKVIRHTLGFLEREMRCPDGGYYAALDADSEGVEGKFYVWSKEEVTEVLGEDAALFCAYYDVTEAGNWEHTNILRVLVSADVFCAERGIDVVTFGSTMDNCLERLMARRDTRVRPQTDDKILAGWNALLVTAFCRCAGVLEDDGIALRATELMEWLLQQFGVGGEAGRLLHTAKGGIARYAAFSDDYACMIQACLHLQEITGNPAYLHRAKAFSEYLVENFSDAENGYFFFTAKDQTDVIVRKKEVYDGAVPSGNSVMTGNLFYLGIVFDNREWVQMAERHLSGLLKAVIKHPGSFGIWASALLNRVVGINEIVCSGKGFERGRRELLAAYLPNKVLLSAVPGAADFALLEGRMEAAEPLFYCCRNYACELPVEAADVLLRQVLERDKLLPEAQ